MRQSQRADREIRVNYRPFFVRFKGSPEAVPINFRSWLLLFALFLLV